MESFKAAGTLGVIFRYYSAFLTPKERRTPIRRGPWKANESMQSAFHWHLMGMGDSEIAPPWFLAKCGLLVSSAP